MSRQYFVSGSQVDETTNSQFLADSLFQLNAAAAFDGSGTGSIDTIALSAIAATTSISDSGSGAVDTIALTAISGSASFSNLSAGSIDTISLAAPIASTSIGDTGVGSIGVITLTPISATASFSNSSSGAIDAITLLAISGSSTIIDNGAIDSISLSAPSATATVSQTGSGSIDGVSLSAPSGFASFNKTVSGSIDAITLSAPNAVGGGNTDRVASGSLDSISFSILGVTTSTSGWIFGVEPSALLGTSGVSDCAGVSVGNYAYCVVNSASKLITVDTTNKAAIVNVNNTATQALPFDICTDGTFVYTSTGNGRLQKWDLTTPSAPSNTLTGLIGGVGKSVRTDGAYLYVGEDSTNNLRIFDTATLTLVGNVACRDNPENLIISGNTLYLLSSTATSYLQIFDVTNRAAPALLGEVSFGATAHDIALHGNYIYTADQAHDIVVIDISTPTAPSIVVNHAGTAFARYGSYFVDNYYFSAQLDGTVYYYDVTNPLSPISAGSTVVAALNTNALFHDASAGYFYALNTTASTGVITPFHAEFVSSSTTSATGGLSSIHLLAVASDIAECTLDSISLGEIHATTETDAAVAFGKFDAISIGELQAEILSAFDKIPTVISQYANSPIILQLVSDMMIYFNAAHQRNEFIRNIWDVQTANSQGLDIWGRIVGISRYLTLTNQDYFGFDPDFDPFNNSPFFAGNNVTNTFILSDTDFRRVILAKASANITNCTIPGIENTLSLLFSDSGQTWVDVTGDHELTYVFNFVPTELELAIINAPKLIPRPAGFTIIYDYLT